MNSLSENSHSDTRPVALITGASGRIGAQTARRLHDAMNIVIHYRSSDTQAKALKQELEQSRADSVELVQADLLDTSSHANIIATAEQRFGRLDVLINNASSFYPSPVEEMTEQQWDDLVGSNMKAPLFLSHHAIPLLKKTRGCIINLVDIHGFRPMKQHTIYSMAKAGNAMMVKSLARELAPDIRVNGVAPGAIEWPTDNDATNSESVKQDILSRIPMGRKGEFDDIAKTIRFLILDAPYITGQIIAVDGGRMTQH